MRPISTRSVPKPATKHDPQAYLANLFRNPCRPGRQNRIPADDTTVAATIINQYRDRRSLHLSRRRIAPLRNPILALTAESGSLRPSPLGVLSMQATDTVSPGQGLAPLALLQQTFDLPAFCYAERAVLLPTLLETITDCGGWLLERKSLSATAMEFRLELQLAAIVDLYSAFVRMGLELTSQAHAAMSGLCLCLRHLAHGGPALPIVTLRLEVAFLEEVTLQSILLTGVNLA